MFGLLRRITETVFPRNQPANALSYTAPVPPEILHLIFPYLGRHELAQCCLASRTVCEVAREHLVAEVVLQSAKDCTSFHEYLRRNPEGISFVRSLTIVTEGNSRLPERDWATLYPDKLIFILDKVSKTIFNFTYSVDPAGQSFTQLPSELKTALINFVKNSARLTSISISNLSFPIRVFTSAPQLTSINLRGVLTVTDGVVSTAEVGLSKVDNIQTLTLAKCPNQTLEALLGMYSFPNLREVALKEGTFNVDLVKQLFERIRGSLQKLEWGPIPERSDLPQFGEFTGIESLTLGPTTNVTNGDGAWRWLIPSLESGSGAHGLQELTLHDCRSTSDYNTRLVDDSLYQMLDGALSRPKFGRLRAVTLHVPVSMEEWMDYGGAPSSVVFSKMLHLLESDKLTVVMGGKSYPERESN